MSTPSSNPIVPDYADLGALVKATEPSSKPETIPESSVPVEPMGPPEAQIPVINKAGEKYWLPASQVQRAIFDDKAFTFEKPSPLKPTDLNGEKGRINVVDKDGKKLSITNIKTAEELQQALKEGQWTLQSEYDRKNDPDYQENVELLKSGDDKALTEKTKDISATDENGHYPMINYQTGSKVSLKDREDLIQARKAGYQFADPRFESLYQAHIDNGENKAESFLRSGFKGATFGLSENVEDANIAISNALLKNSKRDEASNYRAEMLASTLNESNKGYQQAGEIIGTAASLLTPEGVLGEAALAGKAAKGIKALKILEDAPIIANVLSHAAQGAIIAAPQAADAVIKGNPKLAAESLGLGAFGGIVLGKLGDVAGNLLAGEGQTNKILSAVGGGGEKAAADILKLEGEAKNKIVSTLSEAGLKDTSNAEKTFQVLNNVSGGSKLSILDKLESVSEKVSTSSLKGEIGALTQGVSSKALASGGLAPELESAIVTLQKKIEKIIPEGEASLTQVQKLSAEISESLGKISGAEGKALTLQARDLVMKELIKTADIAASKANVATAAAWAEQKSIAQAAGALRGGFEAQILAAEKLANQGTEAVSKGLIDSSKLADKVVEGGLGKLKSLVETGFATAGATVGHAILPFLPFIGGGVGATAGNKIGEFVAGKLEAKYGGQAIEKATGSVKSFLEKVLPSSGGKNWLIKNAENPNISSYLTINAVHNTNQALKQIPEFLKNPLIKSSLMAINSDPIKSLLGEQANGLSKAQQFDRLSNKISMLAGNDQMRDQHLDDFSEMMAKNHPEVKAGLKTQLNDKIQAVNDLLHSGNKTEITAFQKQAKYVPTKDQMNKIEAGLNAIENPYVILDGLRSGKVSAQQVSLVKQIYPAIYQEMVNEINKEAFGGKTQLSHQQRISASMITGQPMDSSLKNVQSLQATYAQSQPQQNQPAPKKQGNSKPLKASKIASYTTSQRITQV